MTADEGFTAWVLQQDDVTTRDAVWRVKAYRLGTYVQECAWRHACALNATRATRGIADQLYRAVGSVPANIAEAYGRSSRRDRCRFYEYALSSAREAVSWYRAALPIIGAAKVARQHALLQEVIRLLLVMIRTDRGET